MKKILVIGFGSMGCRHVQSLLSSKSAYDIHVVEPYDENIAANSERIGARPGDFTRYRELNQLNGSFDLAIVATSSGPRFEIVKWLLQKGVKLFLLEKIVFQSESQFSEIIRLMDEANAKAYCNFVSRYFPAYNEIRDNIPHQSNISMVVHGGEFGLGCNAIHYIDMFQYLTEGVSLQTRGSLLSLSETENRRGKEYREFTGVINLADAKNNDLILVSEKGFTGGVTINIEIGDRRYLLSEQTQQMFAIGMNGISSSEFAIIPTSKLTHTIVQDIFSGRCRLTQVKETFPAHALLFNSFNSIIYNSSDANSICPIT
ncbi:MAG TPA: Gfo/Idh/MocA family oxidoreductase [Chitinophagaceae bacterium]